MDWAEELKMSIRKTTARKGRRAKNRDSSKDSNSGVAKNSTSGPGTLSSSSQNPVSIDISLDVQQQQSGTTLLSSSSGGGVLETKDTTTTISGGDWNTSISTGSTGQESANKRPNMLRRISGGWADATFSKSTSSKSKRETSQIPELDTRTISSTETVLSSSKENIPIIPDLDEFNDEYFNKDMIKKASISGGRLNVLQEIHDDLQEQDALCSTVPDVDLHILIDRLQPKDQLNEPDEIWEWDQLFIELVAELNAEKPPLQMNSEERRNMRRVLGPDELPPPANSTTRFTATTTKDTLEKT